MELRHVDLISRPTWTDDHSDKSGAVTLNPFVCVDLKYVTDRLCFRRYRADKDVK